MYLVGSADHLDDQDDEREEEDEKEKGDDGEQKDDAGDEVKIDEDDKTEEKEGDNPGQIYVVCLCVPRFTAYIYITLCYY